MGLAQAVFELIGTRGPETVAHAAQQQMKSGPEGPPNMRELRIMRDLAHRAP